MPAPLDERRPRRVRRRGVIGLAVLVLLAGVTALAVSARNDERKAEEREALVAFQDKLVPLAQEWGRIEVQGMRPAIADLQSGEGVPAATIAGEARAWQAGLEGLRTKISELDPPASLTRAMAVFDRAMGRYIDAAAAFEAAADGPAESRQAGIERGVEAALEGARLYNEASLLLQRARQRLGLPPTADFPNHPAGNQMVD